jgi:HAMP domain-containing protein
MKPNFLNTITKSLSAKLSLWVVLFVSILFAATFSLMAYYARQAVHDESLGKVEDMLNQFEIDTGRMLHEKEVVTRQTHWWIEQNLNDTVEIGKYIQQILANEPEVIGIAAAFVHGTYPDRGDKDYMIYYHRWKGKVVRNEQFAHASYLNQQWYEEPLRHDKSMWTEPREDYRTDDEPIITYAIPLHKDGKVVGTYGVDISIYWLSQTIQAMAPLPNIYGELVTNSGAFVIHPDTAMLRPRAVFKIMEQYPEEKYSYTAYKMLAGQSGHEVLDLDGSPKLLVYRPFEDTKWTFNVIGPEAELMGSYHSMVPLMLVVVLLSLIAIVAFCTIFIHRELHPLRTLEKSAKLVKKGHYDVPIKATNRQDEVGVLTNSFIAMQKSIKQHVDDIDANNLKLIEQNWQLTEVQKHKDEADKVKTAFLQNMTDQMSAPVSEIARLVEEIRQHHLEMSHEQIVQLANQVDENTFIVTQLSDKLLELSAKTQQEEEGQL